MCLLQVDLNMLKLTPGTVHPRLGIANRLRVGEGRSVPNGSGPLTVCCTEILHVCWFDAIVLFKGLDPPRHRQLPWKFDQKDLMF